MSDSTLILSNPVAATHSAHFGKPLGRALIDMGYIDAGQMLRANAIFATTRAPLDRICLSEGYITEDQLLSAQALRFGATRVDGMTADPALSDVLPIEFCRKHSVLPWAKLGNAFIIATSRPEEFEQLFQGSIDGRPVIMGLCPEAMIHKTLHNRHSDQFTRQAETMVPMRDSVRGLNGRMILASTLIGCAAMAILFVTQPNVMFAVLALWASVTLILSHGLKLLAFGAVVPALLRLKKKLIYLPNAFRLSQS